MEKSELNFRELEEIETYEMLLSQARQNASEGDICNAICQQQRLGLITREQVRYIWNVFNTSA